MHFNQLKKHIQTDIKKIQRAADNVLQLHNAEKEIRLGRRQAEISYQNTVRQIRSKVKKESKELKELMK